MSPAPKHTLQEQEDLILEAAARCIEASSLLDFTMSAISKEAGLSMGSIYKHMQSKEDVLVALGWRSLKQMRESFETVLSLNMPAATRLLSVQLFCHEKVSLYSFGPHLEMLLGNEAILQRASQGWLEKMIKADISIEQMFQQKIIDAIEDGEFKVEIDDTAALAEEIVTGLWSIGVGHTQVMLHRSARNIIGRGVEMTEKLETNGAIIRSTTRLINSYPWKQPVTEESIEHACQLMQAAGLR